MKKWTLISIIALVILSIFLWYTISPLFIDKVVNEELPVSSSGSISEIVEKDVEENEKIPISSIYEGNFVDADSFHKASGKAKIISDSNKMYLRFEDFKVTNGPDLYVYLSTDTNANDFVNLGRIKGNIGDQNYEISLEEDLEKYNNVLIWCQRFGVLFGSSELKKL